MDELCIKIAGCGVCRRPQKYSSGRQNQTANMGKGKVGKSPFMPGNLLTIVRHVLPGTFVVTAASALMNDRVDHLSDTQAARQGSQPSLSVHYSNIVGDNNL